jgi:hypothetical protein
VRHSAFQLVRTKSVGMAVYELGWRGTAVYLLSYDIWIVTGLGLKRAVVGPQVSGVVDAGDTAFVHL